MVAVGRAAASAAAEDQRLCRELSSRLGVAPPALLITPFLSGPCLTGIFRPAILLPEMLSGAVLRSVLIHELAHLRRGDCAWNLASKATVAVLFFQPLVWRLSRLLEAAAEDVCDDFVVEYGADRQTYANLLVELAKKSLVPNLGAVVPLITLRSTLAQRVLRIMDRTRPLQLNVSSRIASAILTLGVAATLAATALGSAGRSRLQDREGPSSGSNVATFTPADLHAEIAPGGDYKVGDRIVVIHQNVPILVNDKTVDHAFMGWNYTIDQIEESRLWVAAKTPGWIEKQDTVPYASAVPYFDKLIEHDPTNKQARRAKATLMMLDGALDAAIAEFTTLLQLDPKDDTVWNDLGRAWVRKGDYDRAIADFSEAIRIRFTASVYFHNRGEAWYLKGDAANAIKDWKRAARCAPSSIGRSGGWLGCWPPGPTGSSEMPAKRSSAKTACELSAWQDVPGLESLAAAYAESGDFVQAMHWQTKANEINPHQENRAAIENPLDFYKQGKPYRDDGASHRSSLSP